MRTAGDFNGDGFDDLLLGNSVASPHGILSAGQSYLVFGRSAPYQATLDVSNLDGRNGFVINGFNRKGNSGGSVSTAGDVNGDGFDDVLIGALGNNRGAGVTYLVFGSSGDSEATIELSSLDGLNGFVINGIDQSDYSGSVSTAGDVNGDGFHDVLIGAYGAASFRGEGYVVFGGDFTGAVTQDGLPMMTGSPVPYNKMS